MITLGRFVTNSTIGLGGLFDPATSFGLERHNEDFGKTLGLGRQVRPLPGPADLRPQSVRSASGFAVDAASATGS